MAEGRKHHLRRCGDFQGASLWDGTSFKASESTGEDLKEVLLATWRKMLLRKIEGKLLRGERGRGAGDERYVRVMSLKCSCEKEVSCAGC